MLKMFPKIGRAGGPGGKPGGSLSLRKWKYTIRRPAKIISSCSFISRQRNKSRSCIVKQSKTKWSGPQLQDPFLFRDGLVHCWLTAWVYIMICVCVWKFVWYWVRPQLLQILLKSSTNIFVLCSHCWCEIFTYIRERFSVNWYKGEKKLE